MSTHTRVTPLTFAGQFFGRGISTLHRGLLVHALLLGDSVGQRRYLCGQFLGDRRKACFFSFYFSFFSFFSLSGRPTKGVFPASFSRFDEFTHTYTHQHTHTHNTHTHTHTCVRWLISTYLHTYIYNVLCVCV